MSISMTARTSTRDSVQGHQAEEFKLTLSRIKQIVAQPKQYYCIKDLPEELSCAVFSYLPANNNDKSVSPICLVQQQNGVITMRTVIGVIKGL